MKQLVLSDLRQRTRGKRWWIVLAIWTLVLAGLVALVRDLSYDSLQFFGRSAPVGPPMFGSLALLIVLLACLVVPALTATSINSERDRGTLAVLQVTLLRPWQIVAARFVAALIAAGAFLAATVPLALWAFSEGGVAIWRALVVYLVLVVVCAVLIVLALASSALFRRPSLSAVVSYILVFFLTIGTPIVFALLLWSAPRPAPFSEPAIGWRWVVLAPNPVVVLADAAPRSESTLPDPLDAIRDAARFTRDPQPPVVPIDGASPPEPREPPPVWPTGLAILVALAAVAAYATTDRLRVPARHLAPGQRIA